MKRHITLDLRTTKSVLTPIIYSLDNKPARAQKMNYGLTDELIILENWLVHCTDKEPVLAQNNHSLDSRLSKDCMYTSFDYSNQG